MKGSLQESAVRGVHWAFLGIVVCWTVYAAAYLSAKRIEAKDNMDGSVDFLTFTLPSELFYSYGKYIITVNIKICAFAWDMISPRLANCENWPTQQAKTNAAAFKMFIVKFVVYYYPFFYTVFVQPFIDGCPGEDDFEGCEVELKQNILIFLLCHLGFTIFALAVPFVQTAWLIRQEAKKVKAGEMHDYLQLQAKLPDRADDGTDYVDTVINLGFTTLFSCISPVMTMVCLLTLLIEVHLFAFRDTYLSKRAEPKIADGIGPWLGVMQTMAYISVMVNVGFLSFMMWPLRDLDLHHQLMYFVALEHAVMLVTIIVTRFMPSKSTDQSLAEEINTAFVDELYDDLAVDNTYEPRQLIDLDPSHLNMKPKLA